MELFSSPMFSDPEDFGLSDPERNAEHALYLQSLPTKKKLFVHKGAPVVMYGDPKNSRQFYIAQIVDGEVSYFVNVELKKLPQLPSSSATQVEVWRSSYGDAARYNLGLAKKVFSYLLRANKTVVSDSIQTRDGERFWKDRLIEALLAGNRVGLIVQGESEVRWSPQDSKEYRKWIIENDPWGKAASFMQKRLVIQSTRL